MDAATRRLVRQRARERCEYCHLPEVALERRFHVEHIVARQHHGGDEADNLALACDRCNRYKGPNLSAIDPATGDIVPLFNPRRDAWEEHFAWTAAVIDGLTPSGRATVRLLQMNAPQRVKLREEFDFGDVT